MRVVVAMSILAIGCGDGGETVGLTGTGGAPMTSGTGGAGSTGGAGGSTPMGYGEITAADALVCEEWPLCPEGVYAFRGGVAVTANPPHIDVPNRMCDESLGRVCGECSDFRTGSCAPFVARCRAPFVSALVCPPMETQPHAGELQRWQEGRVTDRGHFRQCTGNGSGSDSLARVACGKT